MFKSHHFAKPEDNMLFSIFRKINLLDAVNSRKKIDCKRVDNCERGLAYDDVSQTKVTVKLFEITIAGVRNCLRPLNVFIHKTIRNETSFIFLSFFFVGRL